MGDHRTVTVVRYSFRAELWLWHGQGGWHFLTLPTEVSDDIEGRTRGASRGFGSVPVAVTIGATTWRTSLFPDRKAASYVLPVKKAVRVAEQLDAGDRVEATVELSGAARGQV